MIQKLKEKFRGNPSTPAEENQLPVAVAAALTRLDALQAEASRIREVLVDTTADLESVEVALADQRQVQAANEAQAALRGEGLNAKPFGSNQAAARVEALRARGDGLRAKQAEVETSIAAARSDLETAWREFAAERVAEVRARFEAAAKTFDEAICEGLAVLFACGDSSRVMRSLSRVSVLDCDQDRHLIRPDRFRWRQSPEATAIYDELTRVRNQVFASQGVDTSTHEETAA